MSSFGHNYFPILRGRQNELMAVRELAREGKLAQVLPVIEPVKASSTLIKTLAEAFDSGAALGIVFNPQAGSFVRDLQNDSGYRDVYQQLLLNHEDRVLPFLYVANETTDGLESLMTSFREGWGITQSVNVIIARGITRETAVAIRDLQNSGDVKMVLSALQGPLKYFRRGRILLNDSFKTRERNADYRNDNDEYFSDGPSSFDMYGCVGFSDYSIVGETYRNGGFSPRAVALHVTYFNKDWDTYVRHFVSTPPDDTGDVPGKYADAAKALYDWVQDQDTQILPRTIGLKYFMETYEDKRFPGLGLAKKFSIMHHLEMINWYLGVRDELLS